MKTARQFRIRIFGLDPVLAKKEVEVIEKGFEKLDPKDKSYFQGKRQKTGRELDFLTQVYHKPSQTVYKKIL